MRREDFEALGNRQKAFESAEANRRLMAGIPVLVRLDGRAFHTFTRGLDQPYDERFRRAMAETAKYLVAQSHASIGYTQSDEISLAFPNLDPEVELPFSGRIQKLCSVLASQATAKFNEQVRLLLPEKADALPVFDARVWAVPNLEVAAEHFLWREADATRNSLTMAAHAHYSHKELQKAGYAKKHEMLFAKGINWNDYPAFFKRGVYVRRQAMLKSLSAEELARIPEKNRPTGPVMRTQVVEVDMPPLSRVSNKVGTLFHGETPTASVAAAVAETPED